MTTPDDKNLEIGRILPPAFKMDPSLLKFNLSYLYALDPAIFKRAVKEHIEYLKKCADAEAEMYNRILDTIKEHFK
jgi:hypothetical protein